MHTEAMRRLVDALSDRILLCSAEGETVHANRAVEQLLRSDPDARVILNEVARAVRNHLRRSTTTPPNGASSQTSDETGSWERQVEIATGRGRYLTCLLDLGGETPAGVRVLVRLEPLFDEPLSDPELRAAYGLTAREVLVARYLAEGLSNNAIARALAISPHTVRRHTERVLRKVDVASRSAVRSRIHRGSALLRAPTASNLHALSRVALTPQS